METLDLVKKYNVAAPRYTSYPTVPFWKNDVTDTRWFQIVKRAYYESASEGISLYIHLPFCESLCTYCGCSKHITTNHSVENDYIEALLDEWHQYVSAIGEKPIIRELHLGGGTPTFFQPKALERLINGIFAYARKHEDFEASFEGHPNNTTGDHLITLFHLGFGRVSFGVQDLDLEVQKAIHRIQPFENLEMAVKQARRIGYRSINFDLVYGLPHQSLHSLQMTLEKSLRLSPDRIAFYSYAHVPSMFPSQKAFEQYLPDEYLKKELYDTACAYFTQKGYKDIGMDHFTKDTDTLYQAYKNGKLHRNFMGYTAHKSGLLLGLGASSISDAGYAYRQNEKKVKAYEQKIKEKQSLHLRSHLVTVEEAATRAIILQIACNGQAQWTEDAYVLSPEQMNTLDEMQKDGLLTYNLSSVSLSQRGRQFTRNICAVFDKYLMAKTENIHFSKAI